MLEAYEYSAWDHTASLLALVAGLVKQGVKVENFHPYRREEARQSQRVTSSSLKALKGSLKPWREPNGKDV